MCTDTYTQKDAHRLTLAHTNNTHKHTHTHTHTDIHTGTHRLWSHTGRNKAVAATGGKLPRGPLQKKTLMLCATRRANHRRRDDKHEMKQASAAAAPS